MNAVEFSLPIYYTVERKRKASSTHLVSDNWTRNLHHHLKNAVKQHYHELIAERIPYCQTPCKTFNLRLTIYYKAQNCDPSNIAHQMEKFVLDALQELNYIENDTVLHHIATHTSVGGQDKSNPRCNIYLEPLT